VPRSPAYVGIANQFPQSRSTFQASTSTFTHTPWCNSDAQQCCCAVQKHLCELGWGGITGTQPFCQRPLATITRGLDLIQCVCVQLAVNADRNCMVLPHRCPDPQLTLATLHGFYAHAQLSISQLVVLCPAYYYNLWKASVWTQLLRGLSTDTFAWNCNR
jgi:hypothetical protein